MKAKDLIKYAKNMNPERPIFMVEIRPNDVREAIGMSKIMSAGILYEAMNGWDDEKMYAFAEQVFKRMEKTPNMVRGWNWETIGEMTMAVYEEDRSEWN